MRLLELVPSLDEPPPLGGGVVLLGGGVVLLGGGVVLLGGGVVADTVIEIVADFVLGVGEESWTVRVAVNVPEDEYRCEGDDCALLDPSPNVHEYEYGAKPPLTVEVK
jgi:hypothetical protein